jgi:SAM-dependent methyltransferase
MSANPSLSDAADTLLLAWAFLRHGGLTRDPRLREIDPARRFLGRPPVAPDDTRAARAALAQAGLAMASDPTVLRLTADGTRRARDLYRDWAPLRFEELLAAADTIPAYARHLAAAHPGAPAGSFGFLDGAGVRAIVDALRLSRGDRVLELGAGNGGLCLHLARRPLDPSRGSRVTAVDRAVGAMARLQGRARKIPGPGSVEAVALDLNDPQAAAALSRSGPWDGVIAADVFDFLDRPGEILGAVARRLAPGGRAVFVASEAMGAERLGGLLDSLPGEARIDRVDLTAVEARFWERQLAGLERWAGMGSRAEDDLLAVLSAEAAGGLARMRRGGTRRTLWRYTPAGGDGRGTLESRQGVASNAARRSG